MADHFSDAGRRGFGSIAEFFNLASGAISQDDGDIPGIMKYICNLRSGRST
jgi:hypothetical protein